jgi:hypothetical protein
MFKNNMSQLIFAASKQITELKELQAMGPPVINLVWEFAYPTSAA